MSLGRQARSMRVFVAGATGVLGRRVVAECTERGHDVVGLTRDDRGDAVVRDRGGEPRRGDLLEPDAVQAAANDADVLVHAATKIPTDTNPDESDWTLNDRVRGEGAENLVAAAAAAGADRLVLQSVVWLARQPDGRPFDETDPPNPDRSTRSALAAEQIVEAGAAEHGVDAAVLRGGYFYAADTAHTQMFGRRLLDGRLPVIGGGVLGRRDAALSFLHADDAGRAFADAALGDATGTFHVVDDEPTAYADFVGTLAGRLGAPSPNRVPAWLARLRVDDNLVRLLTRPMPTGNDRFREAFGWAPRYPTVAAGIDQVVERWLESGTIRERGGGYEWTGE